MQRFLPFSLAALVLVLILGLGLSLSFTPTLAQDDTTPLQRVVRAPIPAQIRATTLAAT